MQGNPLVSIIVPCYNGENLIGRLFNSVLKQTYRPIELVVVDDGSNDNSASVVESYRSTFEGSDILLKYVYQDNQGLGGAINTGLKHFTGEYLCWADIDDFYAETSIEKRIRFLQNNPDYAVVTSDAYIVDESDITKPIGNISEGVSHNSDPYQFWHTLVANTIFCAGSHMFRTKDFLRVNPTRSIYPARRGQNWQMLLPMYYSFKRYFLDEPLYYYVAGNNSMSHDHNFEQKLERFAEHENIIIKTLESIDMSPADFKKATVIVQTAYTRRRMYLYINNKYISDAKEQYKILKSFKCATLKDWLKIHPKLYGVVKKILP